MKSFIPIFVVLCLCMSHTSALPISKEDLMALIAGTKEPETTATESGNSTDNASLFKEFGFSRIDLDDTNDLIALASKSSLTTMDMLKLQYLMQKHSFTINMLSNIMSKISETNTKIIKNISQ